MNAISIKDLYGCLTTGRPMTAYGLQSVAAYMGGLLKYRDLEQFNFGTVNSRIVLQAAKDANPIIQAELFKLPFNTFVYRCDISDNGNAGMFFSVHGDNSLFGRDGWMVTIAATDPTQPGVTIFSMWLDPDLQTYSLVPNQEGLADGNLQHLYDAADSGVAMVIGLTSMLQAKGVPTVRTAPPAKPNAKRAQAGLPLIPYITEVDLSGYSTAAAAGPGTGTHASPRPHLRRAHLRRVFDLNGVVKKMSAVPAHVVGWRGPITSKPSVDDLAGDRAEYRVR